MHAAVRRLFCVTVTRCEHLPNKLVRKRQATCAVLTPPEILPQEIESMLPLQILNHHLNLLKIYLEQRAQYHCGWNSGHARHHPKAGLLEELLEFEC